MNELTDPAFQYYKSSLIEGKWDDIYMYHVKYIEI